MRQKRRSTFLVLFTTAVLLSWRVLIYISMLAGFRDVIESNMAPDEHNKQKDSHHFKKMFVFPKQSSETRDWATSTDTNQVSHSTAFLSVHPFPGKPLSLNRS